MANFDVDQYFANQKAIAIENAKIAADNTPIDPILDNPIVTPPIKNIGDTVTDKIRDLYLASKQKVLQLSADIGNIKIAQDPEKVTLTDQFKAALGGIKQNINAPLDADPQKNTYAYKAWVAQGKPGIEFNPNSSQAHTDNLLARMMSGASSVAGSMVSSPMSSFAADTFSRITPQDLEDYNSVTLNERSNSPENMDLAALARLEAPLPKRRVIKGMVTPTFTSEGDPLPPLEDRLVKNKRDLIENYLQRQKTVNNIANTFDLTHLVDRDVERRLLENSTTDVAAIEAKFEAARKARDEGNLVSAAGHLVKGVEGTVKGVVSDFINTPGVVEAATLENGAQVALGMTPPGAILQTISNVGRSGQMVAKGIEDTIKNSGEIPTHEQISRQYVASGATALLETVGDRVGNLASSGAVKSIQALNASLLKPIVNVATKAGVADGVGVVAKGAGKVGLSTATEGLTEYFQAPLENIAENTPYDPNNQRVSAVMGMGGGMGMSTPGAVVSAIVDKATEINDKRKASSDEAVAFYKAATANDASAYTDPTAKTYDPVKAAGVHFTNSQQEATTPEVKAENLVKVTALEAQMQADIAEVKASVESSQPKVQTALLDQQAKLTAALAIATPAQTEQITQALGEIQQKIDQPVLDTQSLKDAGLRTTKMEKQLEQITAMRTRLELEASAQGSQDTVNAQTASTEVPVTPVASTVKTPPADTTVNQSANQTGVSKADTTESFVDITTTEDYQKQQDDIDRVVKDLEKFDNLTGESTPNRPYPDSKSAAAEIKSVMDQYGFDAPVSNGARYPVSTLFAAWSQAVIREKAGSNRSFPNFSTWIKGRDERIVDQLLDERKERLTKQGAIPEVLKTSSVNAPVNQTVAPLTTAPAAPATTSNFDPAGYYYLQEYQDIKAKREPLRTQWLALTKTDVDAANAYHDVNIVPLDNQLDAIKAAWKQSAPANVSINQSMEANPQTTTVDTAEETQSREKTIEDQNASVPEASMNKEKNDGGLDVLNQPVSPKGTAYNLRNVVTDFFTQNAGKDTNGTQRPLVKVRDFLSSFLAEPTLAEQFVKGKELTERQQSAVAFFAKTAKAWNPIVQAALFKRADPAYYAVNDPLQFLFTEVLDANGKPTGKFDADENFKTAISFAAFSLIQDMAGKGSVSSQETINAMLGRESDAQVSPEEWAKLAKIGTLEALLSNSAGQVAFEALGLKAQDNAPLDLIANMKSSMGAHAMKLLIELGYVKRTEMLASEFQAMINPDQLDNVAISPKYTGKETLSFFALVREGKPTDRQNPLTGELQQIVDSVKQSQSVLDKLFSIESAAKMPSLEPIESHQTTAKNTDQKVPDTLGKVIDKKLGEEQKIRQDLWHIGAGFSRAFFMKMAGFEGNAANPEEDSVHVDRRLSVDAKNEALLREYDNYLELGRMLESSGTKDLGQPFFLDYSVWKLHRVGIATNGFNPNASKLQRQLSYQPDWETKVDMNNQTQMDNFYLRIAEGFGQKTDKASAEKTLPIVRARLAQADITEAVELLRQRIFDADRKEFSDAEQEKISAVVKIGGENLHSLNSLVGLAHLAEATKTKQTSFTVQIPAEVDGKTNGSMLASLMFGAANSPAELFGTLNRGGFYQEGSPDTQFNIWKGQGNQDLYEKTIANTMRYLQRLIQANKVSSFMAETVQAFTKSLVDPKTNDVASAGRNLIKKPTTEVVYGSSITKSVNNMAETFVESVYERIEEVHRGDYSQMDLPNLIKQLNHLLSGVTKFPDNTTAQQLLEHKFSPKELEAIKDKFVKSIGKAAKDVVKGDFATFIHKRQVFTATAGLTFSIYKAVYDTARKDYIQELVDLGEIASTPAFDRTNKVTGKVTRIAAKNLHDLSAAQERVLKERLLAIYPIMHSLFSKESNQLDAAMFIGKTEREISDDSRYNSEVQFGTPVKDTGAARMNVAAFQTNQVSPGVAMLPLSILSSDSHISHGVQAQVNALNQHDALIAGVGNIKEVAALLNKGTWETTLNYSPATEMYEALVRTVMAMEDMLATKQVSQAALDALAKSIVETVNKYHGPDSDQPIDPRKYLSVQLGLMKSMAFSADRTKLETMALMGSIDQYTFEGGNYVVTAENRAKALEMESKLTFEVDPETQAAVDSLEARLESRITAFENDGSLPESTVPDTGLNETVADNLTNAQAFALLSHAVKDKTLGEQVLAMLSKVMTKLRESKGAMNLVTAIKVLDPANRAEIAQLLMDRAAKIPANLWGEQGRPLIKSDAQWVSFFEKRGNVKGEQLVRALRDRLTQDGGPSNVKDFNLEMLSRISKLISPTLTIRYVTPATAPSQVIEQAKDNARAWYIATTDGVDTIYVLSTDFKHSGLTTETLLHEILHSAVARTIKAEQDLRRANPARKSALLDIIDDLEGLRKAAEKFIQADPELAANYGPAVKDIDELIAWGMTNLAFQQEVLNKIQVASRTNNNLIAGFKAMINSLVAILFKKTEGREQEILGSGLSVLISNVSDLFTEAENKQGQAINETLNRSQTNTAPDPAFYTTAEIYDSLAGVSPASMGFDGQLRSLLSGIVNKLHGTAGVLHESLMDRQALSVQDVYLKALATGQAPFASATVASGFHFSQQEGFVIEQVEATVRAAIDRNQNTQSFAYKELDKLYNEAKTKLSPKDFHQGDWNTATQVEKDTAQELYNFLFVLAKSTPSTNISTDGNTNANADRLAHLSRFAAMGLAHEGVNKLLQGMTSSALVTTGNAVPTSLLARLRALFDQILAWFSDKQTGVKPGDKPDARLEKLVETLVDIEAKKRASAMARENALFTGLKAASNSVLKAANVGLSKAGAAAAKSNNGAVKGVGFVIGAVASGRVSQWIDNGLKFHDTMNGPTPNVLTETVAYVRGATPQMEELFRMGKKLEADRKAFIDNTSLNVLSSYKDGGKNLSTVQKKAITSLIRGDAQSLLAAGYTLDQLAEFLGNGTQRSAEITKIEESLKALHPEFYKQFLGQSKQLGYFLATGKGSHENTMLNALNIARMYNTPSMGQLTAAQEQAVQALIDPLVSLYAIEYAPTVLRESVREVLLDESARPNGENGIAASLAMHAYLLKDSKDKLFDGSEVLRTKGYLPEIYNPRTDIQIADDVEGQDLINKGYSVGEVLPKDSNDPDPTIRRLYVREDSGMVAHVTGMISLKDMKAKGSAQIGKNQDTNTWVGQLNVDTLHQVGVAQQGAVAWMAKNGDTFDPRDTKGAYMIPTLNSYGEPSNYRYEMSHARKDAILERNNNFEHVLGVFASNTFDKITSAQHNVKVIQALHDHYSVDYAGRSMSYVEVGPNSKDLAMREVYRLLPEATKKEIKKVWGTDGMMVRNDMVTLAFGYRKYSLSEMFDKDPAKRNAAEELFVSVTTFLVASYARLNLGMDAAQAMKYAMRTGVVVKRAEDAWKTISDETKNAIVVKSGIVLLGNIWSNVTLLAMHDISLVDIAKHHKTAFTAAREYQEVSEELFKAQTQLDTGYNVANRKALEQRILVLKDKIARNPVTELMDAGLMPTIVQDVNLNDDTYAYDSNFVKNIKANVAVINPTVLNIGKQLYMTKDTPHYKMLANLTQMSDFVARYTLYQHLTTQAQQPLSKKEAARVASENFVNYDIPLPKGIQYLDDIGILPFTKYFLSMQRVLVNLVREHPVKVLMTLMANNYLHLMPTVMDSSSFSRFGNNPFRPGPLRFVGAVEHIAPIKYAMGLFR